MKFCTSIREKLSQQINFWGFVDHDTDFEVLQFLISCIVDMSEYLKLLKALNVNGNGNGNGNWFNIEAFQKTIKLKRHWWFQSGEH